MGRARGPVAAAVVTRILVTALLLVLGTVVAEDKRMQDKVMSSIVEALGLTKIPDPTKVSFSFFYTNLSD